MKEKQVSLQCAFLNERRHQLWNGLSLVLSENAFAPTEGQRQEAAAP